MKPCVLAILVFFSIALTATVSHAQEDDQIVISVCDLVIPESIKQGHATFYELFSFKVAEDGKPADLKVVTGRFVDEESVKECLSEWRLPPSTSDSRHLVRFQWIHGEGWKSIIISSKEFKQTIRIKPRIGY